MARSLRDVAISHKQNHAMLLQLLRAADTPLDADDARHFESDLAEIDERVQAVSREAHQHAVAAHEDRADRRYGDRRVGERRWTR
jgi:hypothetical protein